MASLNSNSKQIKILIGTPAYGGNCCTAYTQSLIYTVDLLSKCNISYNIKFINNRFDAIYTESTKSLLISDKDYTNYLNSCLDINK